MFISLSYYIFTWWFFYHSFLWPTAYSLLFHCFTVSLLLPCLSGNLFPVCLSNSLLIPYCLSVESIIGNIIHNVTQISFFSYKLGIFKDFYESDLVNSDRERTRKPPYPLIVWERFNLRTIFSMFACGGSVQTLLPVQSVWLFSYDKVTNGVFTTVHAPVLFATSID